MSDEESGAQERPSRLWYILPILFTFIGGIIGYLLLRKKNPDFALRILIIGFVMLGVWFVLSIIVSILLAAIAYNYMSGALDSRTDSLLMAEETSCVRGTASIYVRNIGTNAVSLDSYACHATGDPCDGPCIASESQIPQGDIGTFTVTGCSSGSHYYSISSDTNTVRASFYCPL
jgi:hypothetical protein